MPNRQIVMASKDEIEKMTNKNVPKLSSAYFVKRN